MILWIVLKLAFYVLLDCICKKMRGCQYFGSLWRNRLTFRETQDNHRKLKKQKQSFTFCFFHCKKEESIIKVKIEKMKIELNLSDLPSYLKDKPLKWEYICPVHKNLKVRDQKFHKSVDILQNPNRGCTKKVHKCFTSYHKNDWS